MPTPSCHTHMDQRAVGTCVRCRKLLCTLCSNFLGASELCTSCAPGYQRDRLFTRVLVVVVALAALGSGIAFVVMRRVHVDTSGGEARIVDYGEHAPKIRKLREVLAQEPCDRTKIVRLGEALLGAEDPRSALQESEAFFTRCGEHLRLRWVTYSAHKQLSEFDAAAAEASKLIDEAPEDQDYWWWRGQVHEAGGKLPEAVRDFRQAFLLLPQARNIPFDLAAVYEKTGQPCEALAILDQVAQNHPQVLQDARFKQRQQRLSSSGSCRNLAGAGRALVRFSPHAASIRAVATINGTQGTFIIDTGATLVALTREFADRAKIDPPNDQRVFVRTANGLDSVRLTLAESVSIQEAKAERIEAAVMDGDLGGDVDGLIGLSFLSRFNMRLDSNAGKLELVPRL